MAETECLRPDPVYMAIRGMVTTGPIGAVGRMVMAWIEMREERRALETPTLSTARPNAARQSPSLTGWPRPWPAVGAGTARAQAAFPSQAMTTIHRPGVETD